MIPTAIVLLFSLALILAMIFYRRYELVSGKQVVPLNVRGRSDRFIISVWQSVKKFFIWFAIFFKNLFSRVPDKFNAFLHRNWRKIADRVERYFDKFRRNRGIDKKGSISLYWQSINADKINADKKRHD